MKDLKTHTPVHSQFFSFNVGLRSARGMGLQAYAIYLTLLKKLKLANYIAEKLLAQKLYRLLKDLLLRLEINRLITDKYVRARY